MSGFAIYPPKPIWLDSNGNPLTGGTVEVFLAGTNDHADIFEDLELTVAADNPFTLNARGESTTPIFAAYNVPLKIVVKDSLAATVYTVDGYMLSGGSVVYATAEEVAAGLATTKAVSPATGASAYDRLATAGQHTAGKATTPVALPIVTGTVTPNCALSDVFRVSLTGNITLANPINPMPGQTINIILKQDATGGRTVTLGNKYAFQNAAAPTFSAVANRKDMLSCQYDQTDDVWLCSLGTHFAVPA